MKAQISRRKGARLTASLLLALAPAAFAWPVFDGPHTALTAANVSGQAAKWGKELKHMGKEIAHWTSQIERMQDQLFALQSMGLTGLLAPDERFVKRAPAAGVSETCARAESGGLDRLWQVFVPNMEGRLAAQQQELCARIVIAENAKYNATVDLLLQLREREEELARISRQRFSIGKGKQGDLVANSNQMELFALNMQVDLQRWESTVQGYNNLIDALKKDQRSIARRAFDGNPSPLGTVIGAATLKAAIEAIR